MESAHEKKDGKIDLFTVISTQNRVHLGDLPSKQGRDSPPIYFTMPFIPFDIDMYIDQQWKDWDSNQRSMHGLTDNQSK